MTVDRGLFVLSSCVCTVSRRSFLREASKFMFTKLLLPLSWNAQFVPSRILISLTTCITTPSCSHRGIVSRCAHVEWPIRSRQAPPSAPGKPCTPPCPGRRCMCSPRIRRTARRAARRSRGCTDSRSPRRSRQAPASSPDTLCSWPCPARRHTRSQGTRCRSRRGRRRSRGCTGSRSARRSLQAPGNLPHADKLVGV
jgi:hypothetical protein